MTTSTKPSIIHQESKGVEDDILSDDDGEFSYDSNSDSALSEDDLSIEDDNEREVQEDVTLQDDVGKGMKELTITIETDKDDTKSLQVTTSNDDDVDPQSEQDRVSLSETNLNNSDKREIPRTISDSNQVSSLLGEANEDNSGEAFARLSWSEKLVKKWRRIFWYRGNDGVLYIFNSKHDFDTRVHEQSIVEKKTRKRIKFRQLNFINDAYWDQSIECFTLTETKKKKYAKKGYSILSCKIDKYYIREQKPATMAVFATMTMEEMEKLRENIETVFETSLREGQKCGWLHNVQFKIFVN